MKRIFVTAAAILTFISMRAQTIDSTGFKSRRLKLEEINLVTSYYKQDGENSAVTGGIGTQKLTDFSNSIDIKFTRYDKKKRKHTFGGELGIDHYTSASSDLIDLKANSSASHADTRIYPSLNWSVENEKKRTTIGAELSSSTEFDYQSYGGKISFTKKTKNQNGEFSGSFQAYIDQVQIIRPYELRTYANTVGGYTFSPRNTFSLALNYSQVINQRLQVLVQAEVTRQSGYLSLPFHRVYFINNLLRQENLPSTRLKIPIALSGNYFATDKLVVKGYFRFYMDDWGIISQTASLELPVKITPFFSISPYYRYYRQTASKYFAAYRVHKTDDTYYTSNYDLSKFNSGFYGAGLRYAPIKGVLGMQHFGSVELKYGHYKKNIALRANLLTLLLQYKG